MSRRDVPLWARAVAVLLLWFATWWLLSTATLRDVVGDSIGLLSIGVIAAFMLRGMQLPIGYWADGPWRGRFLVAAVPGVAAIFAAVILVSGLVARDGQLAALDPGRVLAAIVGAVVWGFGAACVRQRSFLLWYAIAIVLGILPFLVSSLSPNVAHASNNDVLGVAMGRVGIMGQGEAASGGSNVVPAFVHLLAIGAAVRLVTEEVAFRRLLIGRPEQSGLIAVIVAAAVATGWHGVVFSITDGTWDLAGVLGVAAICAGSLYVLSRSLMVSATYTAAFAASLEVRSLTDVSGEELGPATIGGPVVAIVTALCALGLAVAVLKRNGLMGGLREDIVENAAGD